MTYSLRQIEAFVAVCNEGSFSKAAQRIHISQSGLSILIRDLEHSLSARLFDRTTRQVMLTEAGREFSAPAARLLADLSSAVNHVRGLAMHQHGHVTVAAPPLLAGRLVVEVAVAFRAAYPGIALKILDVASEAVLPSVIGGQADVGIGAFAGTEQCLTRLLLDGPLVALVPRNHPSAARSAIGWKDLAGLPLIVPTPANAFRKFVDRQFMQLGLQPHVEIEAVQLSTVISLVEAGFGVAVLPPHSALFPVAGSSAVALTLEEPSVTLELVMAYDRFRAPSAAANAFMDVARDLIQRTYPHA
jgi:LysR family carnitine catabolism transcriptional activator